MFWFMIDIALKEKIESKVASIASVADDFPGIIIIHTTELKVVYMSPKGLDQLGIKLEDLQGLDAEKYHDKFFNPEDAREYVPKLMELMKKNTDENVSFFQQVRVNENEAWSWHISSMKILMRDNGGNPVLLITIAF